MGIFNYKGASLEWVPQHGYKDPVTGHWAYDPKEAIKGYVDENPDQRHHWEELTKKIEDFLEEHGPEKAAGMGDIHFKE